MKKSYCTPKLDVHGSIESMTQQFLGKTFGKDDGLVVSISVVTPPSTVVIPVGIDS